jgi:hypothetical protein
MKSALAVALAAILLTPLSATALTGAFEDRGLAVHGPGGHYGVVERHEFVYFNDDSPGIYSVVLLGPISFRLPCRIATLGWSALLMTAVAFGAIMAKRRRIANTHSLSELNKP